MCVQYLGSALLMHADAWACTLHMQSTGACCYAAEGPGQPCLLSKVPRNRAENGFLVESYASQNKHVAFEAPRLLGHPFRPRPGRMWPWLRLAGVHAENALQSVMLPTLLMQWTTEVVYVRTRNAGGMHPGSVTFVRAWGVRRQPSCEIRTDSLEKRTFVYVVSGLETVGLSGRCASSR